MLIIGALLIYLLLCIFVVVSLYFINYHIKKFGIDPAFDNKILKIINVSVISLLIVSFLFFILVPWKSLGIKLF